ncbi:hypothetical protein HYC85_023251 [Camellia sinensis]|uniref:Golgi SNAP receptor complex member 1 n=1 Tax=Camellia sinensis TaxID=4442 RepID=A0A7J7GE17_CAMSI|nr:hypothetical protein HYC85_023251 [Camellia sinensis]
MYQQKLRKMCVMALTAITFCKESDFLPLLIFLVLQTDITVTSVKHIQIIYRRDTDPKIKAYDELKRGKFVQELGGETLRRKTTQCNLRLGSWLMDSVISQAQETLGTLVFQRSTFGGINSKLSNVSSRLPTVNHILSSIKRKKSMDTIILSLVASVCSFLILIYWMTK